MKVQIVIKQGKETEAYEVDVRNPDEWINYQLSLIQSKGIVSIYLYDGRTILIGEEVIKNSIIEFKEIKD